MEIAGITRLRTRFFQPNLISLILKIWCRVTYAYWRRHRVFFLYTELDVVGSLEKVPWWSGWVCSRVGKLFYAQFSSTEMQFVGFHFENGFWNRYKSIIRQICTGHNQPSIKSGLTNIQESWCVRSRDLWGTNRECSSILESFNNYLAGASIFFSPPFNSLYWWLLMQWTFFNMFHEVLNILMALTCTILPLCLVKWTLEQVLCRH